MLAPRVAFARLLDLLRRARAEHASPGQIGGAVAVGLFACCTPLLGLHCFIALALATLFRVNRLWAAVASQASIFGLLRPLIVFAEIELGHYLRQRSWASIDLRTIVTLVKEAPGLTVDWAVGSIPFSLVVASLGGIATWGALLAVGSVRRRRLRRRPPSSESTPSCSRSPSS